MKSFLTESNKFFNSKSIETFSDFCKKYKNNDYISTNDRKKLKSIGIDFENLQNKVLDCIKYFKKQDIKLLHDLLYYVIDDVECVSKFSYIWFSIKCEIEYDINYEIVVSLDEQNLPSKDHIKLDDDALSLINAIIENIYNKIGIKIDELSFRKKDYFYNYLLNEIKNANIDKIKLTPIINIDFKFNNYNYNSNNLIKYLKDEIISRYFDQIKLKKNNINISSYPIYDYDNLEKVLDGINIKIY